MAEKTVVKTTPRKSAVAAKPVAKAEVKQPRRAVTAKAATKPVAVAATVKAAKGVLKLFVLIQGARPTSGPRLWSHTQAALEVLGLTAGGAAKRNAVVAVVGPRAVDYHLGESNLQEEAGKLSLTSVGKKVFAHRTTSDKYDAKLTDAFRAMLVKGTPNAAYRISADNLVPVGLAL